MEARNLTFGHSQAIGSAHLGRNNPFVPPIALETEPDSFTRSLQGDAAPRKFSFLNAAANFVQGGVIDTISGLFSVKGLIGMGITAGLVAVTGPVILPFLAAGGLAIGAYKALGGVTKAIAHSAAGDAEGAEAAFRDIGSGAVSGGLSFLGLRSAYKGNLIKTDAADKGVFSRLFADITGKSKITTEGSQNGMSLGRAILDNAKTSQQKLSKGMQEGMSLLRNNRPDIKQHWKDHREITANAYAKMDTPPSIFTRIQDAMTDVRNTFTSLGRKNEVVTPVITGAVDKGRAFTNTVTNQPVKETVTQLAKNPTFQIAASGLPNSQN